MALAGDQPRELDYAANLQRNLGMGQIVWLNAGDQKFLGLLTEAEKSDNSNAAIVLHDQGEQPDQQFLIHGLRTVLPQHNWTTLAVQLPLREIGAGAADYYPLFDEARERIRASVEFLRGKGAKNIAVIGYGMGAAMAAYSISLDPDALLALAAISLPLPDSDLPQAQIGQFIPKIALPFLDLYAEFDLPEVVDTARQRRMLAKDNPVYRQIRINGENHAYQHDPGMVIKRVYSWLALTLSPN
ncbi:DUF3530 family protein [Methylomonas sp. LL1]|nr:DUF3530 family protein [Methylomonas sp. LL1]